jgi:HPt (histidine-containing phosphotransfer) domain-containing protein
MNADPQRAPPVDPDAPEAGAAAAPALLAGQMLAMMQTLDPQGDKNLTRRLLHTYLESLARLVGDVQAGLAAGNDAAVAMSAHTLKSASTTVGARALSLLCGLVEEGLRSAPAAALAPLLARLVAEAARVDQAVRQLLQQLPPPR